MSLTDLQKANIIQFLTQSKNNFVYKITRKSGKTSIVDNLFCLRKRNPENIVKIEKILKTWHSGNINKKIGELLKVNHINGLNYFDGFNDKKNSLEFREESDWDGYYLYNISLDKVRKAYKEFYSND